MHGGFIQVKKNLKRKSQKISKKFEIASELKTIMTTEKLSRQTLPSGSREKPLRAS
jgi:hypothetical protein